MRADQDERVLDTLFANVTADVSTGDLVERVRTSRPFGHGAGSSKMQRTGKSLPGNKGGECGTNRILSRLRHLFSWAIAKGYINETPFNRGSVTVIRLATSAENARTRRLRTIRHPARWKRQGGRGSAPIETRDAAPAGAHCRGAVQQLPAQ